jgi:flagellar protein FlgJ
MTAAAPTPAVTDLGGFTSLKAAARRNDPDSVRKAAQQFEALFMQQMLKSARAANLGDDVLGGGQTEFYQDLFDQQMALHLSSGKGMGLADVLVRQIAGAAATSASSSALANATENTAGNTVPGALAPRSALWSRANSVAATGTVKVASTALTESESAAPAATREAGASLPEDAQAFIARIRPHAERVAQKLGVPAEAILAQAALETGWGRHVPTHADGTPSHNLFGIKAHGGWDGAQLVKTTQEHLGGRMLKVSAAFRSYDSVGDAFDDYARFLKSNPRYAEALSAGEDRKSVV